MPAVSRRALIVEDDADIVELVSHYLAREGFQAEAVRDGREALLRLSRLRQGGGSGAGARVSLGND